MIRAHIFVRDGRRMVLDKSQSEARRHVTRTRLSTNNQRLLPDEG